MQKNILLIVGAIVLLLVVGAVAFMQLGKSSSKPSADATVSQQKTDSGESMAKGTIQSLLSAGKNVSCTYTTGKDKNVTNGTIYVADKKMRADFTLQGADGKNMDSHMIQDGDYSYFWSSAMPTGTKMKISALPKVTPAPNTQTQNADLNKEYDMKCSSWSVDGSMFTPPADVKFTDMTDAMMKMQASPTTKTGGSSSTSPCDQITDPTSKASCVKAMSGGGY